jgi:sigma-E factor negative regulatory protein RseB
MTRLRANEPFLWLALALLLTGPVAGAAEEPRQWLERMNEALTTRNYDGIFTHWHGGKVETLRIIHRVQDGKVMERLVSLDGSGREFIRRGSELACYMPDQRQVLVEQSPRGSGLLGSLPRFDDDTAEFYDFEEVRRARLNQRDTRVIAVKPKDEFRYGYRLWIDEATGMPLKTQLCDRDGAVIEQIVFASLSLPRSIPDSAFKPDFSTEGFEWLKTEPARTAAADSAVPWSAPDLPPGFRMSSRSAQRMSGSQSTVAHLVFTDGLASVSVFVEQGRDSSASSSGSQRLPAFARVGSSSAFSTTVNGHKVTAVGEVPPATVRFIANSVQAEPVPAREPRR